MGDKRSKGKQSDFFDALEEARLPFEKDGYPLLCYGASLNGFPSGMGRSCTSGKEVYQFNLKNIKKSKDSKSIFDTGKDVVPATINEQRTFFRNGYPKMKRRAILNTTMVSFNGRLNPILTQATNK